MLGEGEFLFQVSTIGSMDGWMDGWVNQGRQEKGGKLSKPRGP